MSPKLRLLFMQRKLDYLEDFGDSISEVSRTQDAVAKLRVEIKDAETKNSSSESGGGGGGKERARAETGRAVATAAATSAAAAPTNPPVQKRSTARRRTLRRPATRPATGPTTPTSTNSTGRGTVDRLAPPPTLPLLVVTVNMAATTTRDITNISDIHFLLLFGYYKFVVLSSLRYRLHSILSGK